MLYSRRTFSWQTVALQARFNLDITDEVFAATALNAHADGLRLNGRCRDDNTRNLYELGHLIRLQQKEPEVTQTDRAIQVIILFELNLEFQFV